MVSPLRWIVLLFFLMGFGWPALWIVALALFEFGVRHGRDVVALWFVDRIHRYHDD